MSKKNILTDQLNRAFIESTEFQNLSAFPENHPTQQFLRDFDTIQTSDYSESIWKQIFKKRDLIHTETSFLFEPTSEELKIIFWLLNGIKDARETSLYAESFESLERKIRLSEQLKDHLSKTLNLNFQELEDNLPELFTYKHGTLEKLGYQVANIHHKVEPISYTQTLERMLLETNELIEKYQVMVSVVREVTRPSSPNPRIRAFTKSLHGHFRKSLNTDLYGTISNICKAILGLDPEFDRDKVRDFCRKR